MLVGGRVSVSSPIIVTGEPRDVDMEEVVVVKESGERERCDENGMVVIR